jgi:hypothetical protein
MGIRSFDYFRKLNSETETSSLLGGIFTLLAIVV